MSGPIFFKHTPGAGKPVSLAGVAQGLAWLEHAWKNLAVHNGHVEWFGHEPVIVLDESGEQIGVTGTAEELDVTVDDQAFSISDGELIIGTRRFVISGCTADGTDATVGDYRWIYVEIETDQWGGTSQGGITDDEYKALDSFTSTEQIYRVNISKWVKTSDGWAFVCKAKPELHQHGVVAG